MKKIKFEKKLNLNKETVSYLNDEQQASIKGGSEEDLAGPWRSLFRRCQTTGCTHADVTCYAPNCPTMGC